MTPLAAVLGTEARAGSRRVWLLVVAGLGVAGVALAAALALGESGGSRDDTFRAACAAVLLLVGLAAAVGLGSSAVNRDADGGWYGLMVGSGGPRTAVAGGRLMARAGLLLAVIALWGLLMQAASAAIGRGADGPLAVHTLSMAENLLLVLLTAALASVALGPVASGVVALLVHVAAQAFVNLQAAADQDAIGSVADPAIGAAYAAFPRAVVSPMISDLQARGEGGPAAPQFEINQVVVEVPAAGAGTVLWTLLWCAALAAATVLALRRRALG